MLKLRYAVFQFTQDNHSIHATCNIGNPSTWSVVKDNMQLATIMEVRTNQYVNQTRAKEIIEQALKLHNG